MDPADLERFLRRAAHDLHEPMVVVDAYLQLLSERALDPDARDLLDGARRGADQTRALVSDVLAYLRAVGTDPKPARVDVAVALDEAIKRLETRVEIHRGELSVVRADADQMRMTLQALVSNALKFHAPGVAPVVRVTATREGAFARVSVTDEGIGIAPEHHARLFEPFVRLHPVDEFPGSGLGLALVKRVVERHGGAVGLSSAPRAGTTVWTTWPLA